MVKPTSTLAELVKDTNGNWVVDKEDPQVHFAHATGLPPAPAAAPHQFATAANIPASVPASLAATDDNLSVKMDETMNSPPHKALDAFAKAMDCDGAAERDGRAAKSVCAAKKRAADKQDNSAEEELLRELRAHFAWLQ